MAFTKITASGIGSTETVTLDGLSVINDGSFGGNVSVGGTLTYEDVTNIDSVGLITARAGVVVGSGITLSKDGDIFATGITTVSGNVKVGTGITLSPDGDGFFTGVVTATTFKGDGSQLSNVTSTTINNNADNRLITGSGSANTLEGESTLTYGGTELLISNASPSVKLNDTDNSGVVDINNVGGAAVIQSTGDAVFETNSIERVRITSNGKTGIGTNSPQEILHVKAASEPINTRDGVIFGSTDQLAADKGLPLVWSAHIGTDQDYGVASICGRKENSTSDNGAGYLQFGTGNAAGAISERMRIDSNGYITMPNRPMFSGRPNISNAFRSATETMQLTSRVNVGGHWSDSNYNFTCPVTGHYFMSCNTISNVETYMYFRKDTGSGFAKIYTSSHSYSRGDGGNYRGLSATHIESCNAGDKLDFYIQGGYYGLEHGSGTIYLLA